MSIFKKKEENNKVKGGIKDEFWATEYFSETLLPRMQYFEEGATLPQDAVKIGELEYILLVEHKDGMKRYVRPCYAGGMNVNETRVNRVTGRLTA
jgi:hypothetical protein